MATTNKGFENKQYGKDNNKNTRKSKQRKQAPTLTPTAATKQKPFLAKKPADKYGDPFEYKMSLACANDILRECPAKTRPEQYLCDYINEEYGLIGWCQRVIIEG